jgi:Spx/MgsR family transcriptional regulator
MHLLTVSFVPSLSKAGLSNVEGTNGQQLEYQMKVYGIVNCNTVKAARAWLDKRKLAYEFVDFKKMPPTKELLALWCAAFGWQNVLNRRGSTWRLLPPAAQARVKDEKSAIALMQEKPTVIKRPVVETGKTLLSGFDEAEYAKKL